MPDRQVPCDPPHRSRRWAETASKMLFFGKAERGKSDASERRPRGIESCARRKYRGKGEKLPERPLMRGDYQRGGALSLIRMPFGKSLI